MEVVWCSQRMSLNNIHILITNVIYFYSCGIHFCHLMIHSDSKKYELNVYLLKKLKRGWDGSDVVVRPVGGRCRVIVPVTLPAVVGVEFVIAFRPRWRHSEGREEVIERPCDHHVVVERHYERHQTWRHAHTCNGINIIHLLSSLEGEMKICCTQKNHVPRLTRQ